MAESIGRFFETHNILYKVGNGFGENILPILIIFAISLLPILELRGGLIVAAILGVPWFIAVPVCLIGNILPIPFVLIFIRKIFAFLKKHFKFMNKILTKLENSTKKKGKKIQNGTLLALILFVGIPLPGTGGWTGALAADLFDIEFKKAFPAIVIGIFMACAIMLILTYLVPGLFGLNNLFG